MIHRMLFIIGIFFLTIINSFAQNSIEGTVKNKNGNPICYTRICILQDGKEFIISNNKGIPQYRWIFTNGSGEYRITNIPEGIYEIKAIRRYSEETVSYFNIKIDSLSTKHLDLVMAPPPLYTPHIVYNPPVWDICNAAVSTKFLGDEIRRMPASGQ